MMKQEEFPTESSYSSSIIRIAVSQICQSVGFHSAQPSALNTITDIAIRHLQAIASSASASANSSGRTQSNAFDIVLALEELGSIQGFPGFSGTNVECVLASSLLVDLERFLFFTDEIPFAKPLPRRVKLGSVAQEGGVGDGVKADHVPRWLPVMPVMGDEEGEGRWEEEWKCRGNEERGEGISEKRVFELSDKRGEVKEEGEKGMRGGVSRSGGFGKRVLCRNDRKNGDGGVEKKRVMVSFKKRMK